MLPTTPPPTTPNALLAGVSRRSLLKAAGVGGLLAVAGGGWVVRALRGFGPAKAGHFVFDELEVDVVEQLARACFPGAPEWPFSADEVGVARFVDLYVSQLYPDMQGLFRTLLRAVNLSTVPTHGAALRCATLLLSGLVAFVSSRGQHFAWAVFVAGGLVGLDALPDRVAALVAGGLLVVIAALHVAWALGFRGGSSVAIPSVEGRAAFRPGPGVTLAVAVAFATGAVVASQATSGGAWRWLALAGAVVCGARTIGDTRLFGLFKRVRGTPFSTWDDLLFTPLSFVLALCFGVLAS